jgi:hypothetical protein
MGASQIDFAHHALALEGGRIGGDDFSHEFVPGRAGEGIIAAAEFEIGIADAAQQKPQQSETRGTVREGDIAKGDPAVFEVDGQHGVGGS